MSKSLLLRPSLGENVPLGTLYDARTDKFFARSIVAGRIPDEAVFFSRNPKIEVKTTIGPGYQQKFALLDFSPDLRASYFADYLKVHGSAAYLHSSRASNGCVTAALLHRLSTCTERLNFWNLDEADLDLQTLRDVEATHIVTTVEWGARSIVELRHGGTWDDKKEAEEIVLAEVEKLQKSLGPLLMGDGHPHEEPLFPSAVAWDIRIFSDMMEEPMIAQDLSEAYEFLSMLPSQVQQLYRGEGIPISYRLVPLSMLGETKLSLDNISTCEMIPLSTDYVERLVSMFDISEAAFQTLASYHAYISRHQSFVSKQHLQSVEENLRIVSAEFGSFEHQLSYLVREVRSGVRPASELDRLLQDFADADSSPSTLAAEGAEVRAKVQFAAAVTSKGGIYVGHNGVSLDSVLRENAAKDVYVMSYSTEAMADQHAWNANKNLLFELLETGGNSNVIVIVDNGRTEDSDTGSTYALPDEVHITLYRNGAQVTDDFRERWEFMADKCLIRYKPDTLEKGNVQKPIKRRFVRIPCPGMQCGAEICNWICGECLCSVEFGYTDQYIYCDCGKSGYANFDFKCCSADHGSNYFRYSDDELLSLLQDLVASDYINILILGETGVGKSTFINAFVNYLTYDSLDQAKEADLTLVIPCAFSTQVMDRESGDIEEYHVKVGHDQGRKDEFDGSKGDSATQRTTVYPVMMGNRTVRLIDTPGIGDTRGLAYDKRNMADILDTISGYDHLHGILILVKSNNARLTITFEFCMKELLTHLHRSAAANMAFGFTNTRISNYSPGDTFGPLKAILGEHKDVDIALTSHTVYCFDSESFRYLAAIKNGVPMPNEEDFRRSWQNSRDETLRLINYFAERTPHPVISTISLNGTRRLIAELTKPMAEISAVIRVNIANCEDQMEDLQNERLSGNMLRRRLHIQKVLLRKKDLPMPRTVCSDAACREFKDDGTGTGTVRTIYTSHCHPECYLDNVKVEEIAHPGLINCAAFGGNNTCHICSHHWQQHLHIMYELEEYTATVKDEGIATQIKKHANEVTLKQMAVQKLEQTIKEYQSEHDQISSAAAQFGVFLKKHSITAINDKTLEYLDYLIQEEEAKVQHGGRDQKLRGLRLDRQKHIELVEVMEHNMKHDPQQYPVLDEQGVDRLVSELYGLRHFGGNLKNVKNGIVASHQATYREIPFRMAHRRSSGYASHSGHGNHSVPIGPDPSYGDRTLVRRRKVGRRLPESNSVGAVAEAGHGGARSSSWLLSRLGRWRGLF